MDFFVANFIIKLKLRECSLHIDKKFQSRHCEYKATHKVHFSRHEQPMHEGIKYRCDKCKYQLYQVTKKGNLRTNKNAVHWCNVILTE